MSKRPKLKPCPFCGHAIILARPNFPHGANRDLLVGWVVECQRCNARVIGDVFDGEPMTYEMYGDTPNEAAQNYAALKWNARSWEEFDATVNGPVDEYEEVEDLYPAFTKARKEHDLS